MNNPEITIILTTYNGGVRGYLDKAILSVINQSYKNFEFIIVDDGSTDNTERICKKYSDDRIIFVKKENGGVGSARNFGIKLSRGSFICFLDDDDFWDESKLEKQISFFNNCKDKKIGILFTGLRLIDDKDKALGYLFKKARGDIYEKLFYENIVTAPSSVMINAEVFKKVGLFREDIKISEDYDFWLRSSKYYHFFSIKEYVVNYRLHKKQETDSGNYKEQQAEFLITINRILEAEQYKKRKKVLKNFFLNLLIFFFK